MKKQRKEYVSPSMEMIPVASGCVMAGSPLQGGNTDAPKSEGGATWTRSPYSNVTTHDVEDMINDIFTVEP
jgi:hypothetical protein